MISTTSQVTAESQVETKGPVIKYGEWGWRLQNRMGEQGKFYPYKKRGGSDQALAMLKRGH